jgi:hypothetical protein
MGGRKRGEVVNAELVRIEDDLKAQVDALFVAKSYGRARNWAGDLGFECDSYQVLSRLKPELKPLPDQTLLKIFRASGTWETPNLDLIKRAEGISIQEQGRPFEWPEKQISGKVDAKIGFRTKIMTDEELKKILSSWTERKRVPLEHKALSPNTFRTVKKLKAEGGSLLKAKYGWMQKYPGQLVAYELMDGSEFGIWFFFEKVMGDYFFWIEPLDYAYGETLIARAERTNEAVAANTIPAPVLTDLCDGCDFERTFCFTGKDFGAGYDIRVDAVEMNETIRRFLELKPIVKEYGELEDAIKALKGKNSLFADYLLKWTPYKMPKMVPSLDKIDCFRMKIEPLKK